MITATRLKAVYDALDALGGSNVYWLQQFQIDANGNFEPPQDTTYYVLQEISDPAVGDFDKEAYSNNTLRVYSWSVVMGGEYALADSANTEMSTLGGWERVGGGPVPSDRGRYGRFNDYTLAI